MFTSGSRLFASQDQCRRGPRHLRGVQHQDHRRSEEFCQFSSGKASSGIHPVVQTAIAFDEAQVTAAGPQHKRPKHGLGFHEKRIQIVAGLPGCNGKPPRIDVIRPFLEGNHPETIIPAAMLLQAPATQVSSRRLRATQRSPIAVSGIPCRQFLQAAPEYATPPAPLRVSGPDRPNPNKCLPIHSSNRPKPPALEPIPDSCRRHGHNDNGTVHSIRHNPHLELKLSRRSPGHHGQSIIVDVLVTKLKARSLEETLPADSVDPFAIRSYRRPPAA